MPTPAQRLLLLMGNRYITLPKNLLSTQHVLIEGFETLGDWTAGGSAILAADTTHFREGTQGLKITPASPTTGNALKTYSSGIDLSNIDCIQIAVYLTPFNSALAFDIFLGNEVDSWTNYTTLRFTTGISTWGDDWMVYEILKTDTPVGGAGSFSWNNLIKRIRIDVPPRTAYDPIATFDWLTAGAKQQGSILLAFDDVDQSIYTLAYLAMRQRKIRGTCYVYTDGIGTGNFMTSYQLLDLNNNGWDIANHTKTHTDLTTLTQAEQETEFTEAKSVLDGLGLTKASNAVAFPGGAYNADTKLAMTATGMVTGRTVKDGYVIIPKSDNQVLWARNVTYTTTLAAAKAWVDRITARGETSIFVFHKITQGELAAGDWAYSDFVEFLDYINNNHIPAITISELYRLQSGQINIPRA